MKTQVLLQIDDDRSYSEYIRKRNRKRDQKEELDEMKKDIDEIKSLLQKLVNNKI